MNFKTLSLAVMFSASIFTFNCGANAAQSNGSLLSDMGKSTGYAAPIAAKPSVKHKKRFSFKKSMRTGAAAPISRPAPALTGPVESRCKEAPSTSCPPSTTGEACPVTQPCPPVAAPCPAPTPCPVTQPCPTPCDPCATGGAVQPAAPSDPNATPVAPSTPTNPYKYKENPYK